jgi:hypothetical protein
VPKESERRAAHTKLLEMIESGLVTSLIHMSPREWKRPEYLIYPKKFLPETWSLLEGGGLARWKDRAKDYGVPRALGFLMMSTLAESCAGTQIQRVTDRAEAYSWIEQHRAKALGSPYVTGLDISQVAPALDRLVTITCEVLDGRKIPLKKLIELRKSEMKSGSGDYSGMRRKYSAMLKEFLDKIGNEAKNEQDVREIEHQFTVAVKQDLADLKAELKTLSWKTLFSKEVAASALIVAGCLVAPVAGFTALATNVSGIGIIPLVKNEMQYREKRRKTLRNHPMSWLYLQKKKLVTLY